MKRFCLALDLKDDPSLIGEYEYWHAPGNVFPEVLKSLTDSGIQKMEIFRTGNRLIMVIETTDEFSFERKAIMDEENPKVVEWETMMSRFQQRIPWAKPDQKWVVLDKVFDFG